MSERVIDCPDCHQHCAWCSWYLKNAREVGCGNRYANGLYRPSKHRCEWDALKGTTCPTCAGAEKVRMVYELLPISPSHDPEHPDAE